MTLAPAPSGAAPRALPGTVMVVDDTPANLQLLDELLRSGGHHVLLFPRGALALKAALRHPPDLILLDILMPEMDGFEVCRQLKTDPQLAAIPVIFLSALGDVDSKIRAFAAGGVDYVAKPFQEEEVLARIDTHLRLHQLGRALDQERQQLEGLVRERTADLERAQRVGRIGSWTLDLTSQALEWSVETCRLFAVPPGMPLLLDDFIQRVHPEDQARVVEAWQAALNGAAYDIEHRLQPGLGAEWVRERAEFAFDADGRAIRALGTVQDIGDRKSVELEREADRVRLQNAIDAMRAGTWEWQLDANRVLVDGRSAALRGLQSLQSRQLSLAELSGLVHPADRGFTDAAVQDCLSGRRERLEVEYRLQRLPEGWVWLKVAGRVAQRHDDGRPATLVGVVIDITEQKRQQEHIEFLASNDVLTALPNRGRFVELLEGVMRSAGAAPLTVAYIDLDGFTAVNAVYGRTVGDALLRAVAERLRGWIGDAGPLARIGGDEFAVAMPGRDPAAEAAALEQLLAELGQPLTVDLRTLQISASIGCTRHPQAEPVDAEQLLRQADQAMYRAKLAGKNRIHHFDAARDESLRGRLLRIDEIRRGLQEGEFLLYYQPKIHLRTGAVVGLEALVRWQHPSEGFLLPAHFIPLLDRHPLAVQLGSWVIESALDQLAAWQGEGVRLAVSVNVDSQQLIDPNFMSRLEQQFARHPSIEPCQLELEILETGALENLTQVAALIERLGAFGVDCALDDFGTGYSSLTFLKQLGARVVKIDQSFVRGMLDDVEDATIVSSVLILAHSFERTSLAEGIETLEQGRMLIELGCELGQGYAIARAMPAAAVPDWIRRWRMPAIWTESRPLGDLALSGLMALVAHGQWMRRLQHYLRGLSIKPVTAVEPCRFGQWLHSPSTQRRWRAVPQFAELVRLHERLHEQASVIVAQRVRNPAVVPARLQELDGISAELIRLCRGLWYADLH
ncbi:MAG: EAL domain-containing protein [Xanthomonadales bacterium]|jgi:diguanylate cyclase (GGDEF)-like protein|nr:EAL domain-containing protein [Xanthomonadales bacterium]